MGALFSPRQLAANELAAEALRAFGALRLGVTGNSMLPAIHPADILLVRYCPFHEAEPDDVVLFARQSRLYAHRVVARTTTHLLTQGDGLAEPDPPVRADELLGKVVRVTRRGKAVPLVAGTNWSARLAGAVFRRLPLAGRVFTRVQRPLGRASL